MRLINIRRTMSVGLFAAFWLITGCTRPGTHNDSNSTASEQPTPGDWIIVRYEVEPDTLNPLLLTGITSSYVLHGANNSQIYEFLLGYDTRDWTISKPLLAESPPQVSEDHSMYVFTIRDGVKWHDGKPLTTDDVLFSFKAAMCPLVDSAAIRSYLTDLDNVEQLEGRKIRFTVSKPNWQTVSTLANTLAILPKHVFDPKGLLDGFTFKEIIGAKGKTDPKIKEFAEAFNRHPNNRIPVGSGPYKFERWDAGREIVLARNDEYWGPKAYLDKIVIRIIPDYTTALTALKAGEIDLNPRLLPIQHAQQTGDAAFDQHFVKTVYATPGYNYIGWNTQRVFFKDRRVRQALTMLVNRQQILDTVRFGLGKIGVSSFVPNSPDFNPNIRPLPYDPKKAQELLDEAGWKDSNHDGIRDKDGTAFRFEFLLPSGSTSSAGLAAIVKEDFRKAGIDMTMRTLEPAVFFENLREHKFDAAVAGWSADLIQDPYQLWHSSSAANGGSNFVSFANAEADRIMEQARLEFDSGKRKQLYWRLQEILHEEQPYTFLWYPEEVAAYHKRFQNAKWIPLRPGYDLNEWFVPRESQKFGRASKN